MMKPFHKKVFFFEGVLLYIILIFAVKNNLMERGIEEEPQSMETSKLQNDSDKEEKINPYKEEKKKVALTFDDGPDPEYTEKLLDGLKERDVKVTFFLTGNKAEKYPDIVKRIDEEGHLIGNHTYSHMQLHNSKRREFKEELEKTSEIIANIIEKNVEYVRPPYGTWDDSLEEEVGMFPVLWDVDPLDWCRRDVSAIVCSVINKVNENDIILLHDQYETTVIATLQIVDLLEERGYEFVTVEELLLE